MTQQFFTKTNTMIGLIGADHRDRLRSVRDLGPEPVPPVVQSYFRGYAGQVLNGIDTDNFSFAFLYADGDSYVWNVAKIEVSLVFSGLGSGKSTLDVSHNVPESIYFNPHYVGDVEDGPATNSASAGYFWAGAVELPPMAGVVWDSKNNLMSPPVAHLGLPGTGHDIGLTYATPPGWRDTHFALAAGTPCVSLAFDNNPFLDTSACHVYANLLSYGWPAAWRKASNLRVPML